jgi:hypothetical protein
MSGISELADLLEATNYFTTSFCLLLSSSSTTIFTSQSLFGRIQLRSLSVNPFIVKQTQNLSPFKMVSPQMYAESPFPPSSSRYY